MADAICYLFGTLGVIWCCGTLGPKLLRIDLQKESRKLEKTLGIRPPKPGIYSAWQPVGFRAYKLSKDALVAGKTIAEAEKSVSGARLFIERIRRGGKIFSPIDTPVLEVGDTVAVIGRTEIMIKLLGATSSETADPELLNIPVASFDLYVTSKAIAGKTLQEIVEDVREARGVLLRGITRGEQLLRIEVNTNALNGAILSMLQGLRLRSNTGPKGCARLFSLPRIAIWRSWE